jgi:hypothetical protein
MSRAQVDRLRAGSPPESQDTADEDPETASGWNEHGVMRRRVVIWIDRRSHGRTWRLRSEVALFPAAGASIFRSGGAASSAGMHREAHAGAFPALETRYHPRHHRRRSVRLDAPAILRKSALLERHRPLAGPLRLHRIVMSGQLALAAATTAR